VREAHEKSTIYWVLKHALVVRQANFAWLKNFA
jgi:hypothetical protein